MSNPAPTESALLTDGNASSADQYDHEIVLEDHTQPVEEPLSPQDADKRPSLFQRSSTATSTLAPIWTRDGLRREVTRRKYARWQEDRQNGQERPSLPQRPTLDAKQSSSASRQGPHPQESASSASPNEEREGLRRQVSRRDTFRQRKDRVKTTVKDAVRGPRLTHQHTHAESVYDILYENQRGMFLCGVPRFSSKSLLNFDPPAWQTSTFHPAAVDITNAQLPDPSWKWAEGWTNWHVDMSFGLNEPLGKVGKDSKPIPRARGDTDEEGWRYSFAFGQRGTFAWHGTHPWFHSFVRRRRWLRFRVKRVHATAAADAANAKSMQEGHLMNADYFTIHNAARIESRYAEGPSPSIKSEGRPLSAVSSKRWSLSTDDQAESEDARDIPALMRALRRATVDRERITAVRNFLDQGGAEVHYLADNVHEILSLLLFQASRQQLLSLLRRRLDEARRVQGAGKQAKREEKDDEGLASGPMTDVVSSLQRASEVADRECQRLEYWSDVRGTDVENDRDAPDQCDEVNPDNEAPIGSTTIFSGDAAAQEEGRSEASVPGDRPENAPDRPSDQTGDRVADGATQSHKLGGEVDEAAKLPEQGDDGDAESFETATTESNAEPVEDASRWTTAQSQN